MKQKKLKYSVGQRVRYVLNDHVLFIATITKAEVKRGLKPYTLLTDLGETKYANEAYLQAESSIK